MAIFTKEDLKAIKELITPSNIIEILEELNAGPHYLNENTIIARTVCHEGDSKKLYYYIKTKSFHCYTNCGTFDIFELIKKVYNMEFTQSVYYVINRFNIPYEFFDEDFNISKSTIRKIEDEY